MNKKYYDGGIVTEILFTHLDPEKMLEVLKAFAEAKGVDAVPVIRCKDCRFFERDHFDAVYFPTESGEAQRVPIITAHEICTRWGDGCKTSADGYCFMAERKDNG